MAIDTAGLEQFTKLLSDTNERFGTLHLSLEALEKGTKTRMSADAKRAVIEENLAKREKDISQSFVQMKDSVTKNNKSVSEAKKTADSLVKSQLNQLDAIEKNNPKLKDQTDKIRQLLVAQSKEFDGRLKLVAGIQALSTGVFTAGKIFGTVTDSALGLVKAVQSGATDIQMAGQATLTAYQTIGQVTQTVGGGVQSLGTGLSSAAPLMGRFAKGAGLAGIAIQGAGLAIGLFGKTVSEVASKIMPVLNAELEKAFNSFNTINSTGAVFADGLTGMVNAAQASDLNLTEFADVLKSSGSTLAQSGLGMTEAAKQMGDVGKAMKSQGITAQLKLLGLTAKEQAEAVAGTMAQMRQTGQDLRGIAPEVIATQTQRYAENLKIIAAITGEDAKKKEAQVKEEANRAAFQAKLDALDPVARQEVIDSMKNMSDATRKGFEEQVVFGTYVTKESAGFAANVDGANDAIMASVRAFQDGRLKPEEQRAINAEYGEQIKNSILAQDGINRAAFAGIGGQAAELGKVFDAELQFRNLNTVEAIKNAENGVRQAEVTRDAITNDLQVAAQAGRDFANEIQNAVLKSEVLKKYAEEVAKTTTAMTNMIQELTGSRGGRGGDQESWMSWLENGITQKHWISNALSGAGAVAPLIGAGIGAAGGLGIASAGTAPAGFALGSGIGVALEGIASLVSSIGFADGGISSGSSSGYLAKLHGTEAVLPENLTSMLMDTAKNKDSNDNDVFSSTERLGTALNNEIQNRQQTSTSNDDLMNILITKVDDLIYATKDVARYTKETSMGVR